jgi:hypothetical protein
MRDACINKTTRHGSLVPSALPDQSNAEMALAARANIDEIVGTLIAVAPATPP